MFRTVRCEPCAECIELRWSYPKRAFSFDSNEVLPIVNGLPITRHGYGVDWARPEAGRDMIGDGLSPR